MIESRYSLLQILQKKPLVLYLKSIKSEQLKLFAKKLAEKNIKITVDSSAKKYIVENGYNPDYGVRPIKRLIQKVILDQLADKIIRGQIKDGSKVKVGFEKSNISISV